MRRWLAAVLSRTAARLDPAAYLVDDARLQSLVRELNETGAQLEDYAETLESLGSERTLSPDEWALFLEIRRRIAATGTFNAHEYMLQ